MNFFTKVKREQGLTLADLDDIRDFKTRLIDSFLYEKLSRAKKSKLLFHVKQIDEWLKENAERVLKSEFAVKPIKIFERSKETNHQYYERHKQKQNGNSSDS